MLSEAQNSIATCFLHLNRKLPDPRSGDLGDIKWYAEAFQADDSEPEGLNWCAFRFIKEALLEVRATLTELTYLTVKRGLFRKSKMVCTPFESESLLVLINDVYDPLWTQISDAEEKGTPDAYSYIHIGGEDVPEGGEEYWRDKFLGYIAANAVNLSVDLLYILIATGVPRDQIGNSREFLDTYLEVSNRLGLKTHIEIVPTGFVVNSRGERN